MKEDLRQIWCACHNGLYDLAGRNVSGPPPRPLEVFEVHDIRQAVSLVVPVLTGA